MDKYIDNNDSVGTHQGKWRQEKMPMIFRFIQGI